MTPYAGLGPVLRVRGALAHTRAALARGELTVGFLGGSITAPQTGTRWPEPLVAWLADAVPGLRLRIENAALGATGSDLAVFRAGPDILARGCHLVFVEFSVNDWDQPTGRRNRSREGLLRQLAAAPVDVAVVHTHRPEFRPDLEAGRVPASIAEFELLAEHYGVSSVWAGLHALREVARGLMAWHEWLPDGLHPEHRGSLAYAQAVVPLLKRELPGAQLGAGPGRPAVLPAPRDPQAWERVGRVPWAEVRLGGPWTLRRWSGCPGMDEVIHCTAPGATLAFGFEGRGLLLGFDFGRTSSEVRWRLDGGPWRQTRRERPGWVGESGWYRPELMADDLSPGRHAFELETVHGGAEGCRAVNTTLGLLGVLR